MDLNGMTPEEFDAAAVARYQADKVAEWEQLEEESYEIAHGLQNDGGHYYEWKLSHECKKYPDHSGLKCAVCGKELGE